MGNPTLEPPSPYNQTPPSFTTNHFSHPHPLHLITHHQNSLCSASKLEVSGSAYACTPCNYILHSNCYKLPHTITHAFHQEHALLLYPKPAYPNGVFNCDACGNQGEDFSYHCTPCGIDLHTVCASLALQYTHSCHPHQLSLTFTSPYPGNSFSCNVFYRVGSKTWLYRCNMCGFDAHLTCVAKIIVNQQVQPIVPSSPMQMPYYNTPMQQPTYNHMQPAAVTRQYSYPNQVMIDPNYPVMNSNMAYNYNQPQVVYEVSRNNYNNNSKNGIGTQTLDNSVNGLASGFGQAAGTVMYNDMFGGGGRGGGGGGGQGDGSSGGDNGGFFNF